MRDEYMEIMNTLEMPQPAIATLWKDIQVDCTTSDNASEYLKTLESLAKNVEYNREGQRPFFTIFKTYTCLDLENERGNIVDYAQRAVEEFGVCGSDLNAAVARWFLGQVYSDQGDAQHRYVVKRFIKIENEACFLCSETKETSGEFEDIPLDKNIHILGIVVAVAKRQDQ